MTQRTSVENWTVHDLMERLAAIPEPAVFDRAWSALGVAVLAAVRTPPPAQPLVAYGAFCVVSESAYGPVP